MAEPGTPGMSQKPQPPKNFKEFLSQLYDIWKNPVTRKKILKKALFRNIFD